MAEPIRRLYHGDCRDIVPKYIEPGSVNLINLDPPFNSKSIYNLPFKSQDETHAAVEAFVDTWTWTADNDIQLHEIRRGREPLPSIATAIDFAGRVESAADAGPKRESSLAAYLANMAERLLATIRDGRVAQETAIVQVKGGKVSPDSVRALSEIVRRTGSVAGILVCFEDHLGTVENQRSREVWSDASGSYPVIQGFSVKDLLAGKRPVLPPQYGRRRGGRINA